MLKIFTDKTRLNFCSELIILGGLIDTIQDKDMLRLGGLTEFCKKNILYTENIEDSNIIVLPYKLKDENDLFLKKYISLSDKFNKPLLTFYIDDNTKKFDLPNNCIIYRTSFSTIDQRENERAIMPLIDDVYNNNIMDDPDLSIGFCGQVRCNRKIYIQYLLKSDLKANFILRPITYFSESFKKDKVKCRLEYFNNIQEHLFTFCYRGYGNYSYRFYEVLMMGRIPILVNTNCVIPFYKEAIEDGLRIVLVDEADFLRNPECLKDSIINFYNENKNHIIDIQKQNRKIYEKFYSYYGFINQIITLYR